MSLHSDPTVSLDAPNAVLKALIDSQFMVNEGAAQPRSQILSPLKLDFRDAIATFP
jgi:hypothetical protein